MEKRADPALTWFLRATALALFPAALAVVMPHAWMNAVHQALGLHDLPDTPMNGYLTRSLSALYALLGAACWFIARDVRRYLPLLRFTVTMTFFFGATVCAIDVLVDMPTLWTLFKAVFVLLWTTALWRLVRRADG